MSWSTYIIKEGKHYSHRLESFFKTKFRVSLLLKHKLKFVAVFSDGTNQFDKDEGDWNKLMGISFGFNHHTDSVRIGWRYNKDIDKIELCSYSYVNGERLITHITNVNRYEEIKCLVNVYKNTVHIIVNESFDIIEFDSLCPFKFKLFPYNGGNNTFDKETKILIKEI